MTHKHDSHLIFCDGSSLGNPGPGGWGTIVVRMHGAVTELGGHQEKTTNNRMEITACIAGFEEIADEEGDVMVYTDSTYVMKGATEWYRGWIQKAWRTSTGEPVLNADLWKKLLPLIQGRGKWGRVRWTHVPGHAGVEGNERADSIATAFAAKAPTDLFVGDLADYAVDILNIDIDPDAHEARMHAKNRASGRAYSYVSEVGGKVMVHPTWAECEARVKGKKARFKKVFSAHEEKALIREFSKPKARK